MMSSSSCQVEDNQVQLGVSSRLKEIEENLVLMEQEAERLYPGSPKSPGYRSDSQNNLIMRHLLILFRGKEMRKYREKIGKQLSFILIQENGLQSFVRATCDLDQTSEKKTTFHQRFRALSTIITDMPSLCCPIEEYYDRLAHQIIRLMTMPQLNEYTEQQWKIMVHLTTALYTKNRNLGKKSLLKPICNPISCSGSSWISINESLIAINRLIIADFDKNLFIPLFPNLLVINLILDETVSPTRPVAHEIILDMLKYVEHSLYLLDDALFNHLHVYNLYQIELVKYGEKDVLSVVPKEKYSPEEKISLSSLDKIVQGTLNLLDQLGDNFKSDFFLLLIEKLSQSSTNGLLIFSLIDSLQDQVSGLILNHPLKAIQFVTLNLRRMIIENKDDSIRTMMSEEDSSLEEKEEIQKGTKMLQADSLSMLIQVVSILLEEKKKLTKQEIQSLKECGLSLSRLSTVNTLSDSEKLKVQSLEKEISRLDESQGQSDANSKDEFEEAILNLNSNFMPMRAHGLATLRKLIDSRNKKVDDNQRQLLSLIKACLSDPESYVYVAAVNALASLALAYTDECLPLLIEAYHDKLRSTKERVSVGESLIWVCKYLGQLSHYYSKTVVNCFLTGLKDEDESIRVSSLSNLGQFCSSLQNALSYYLIEIISAVESLLKTDPSLNVKRACIMFIHVMLNGLDNDSVQVILEHLKTLYHLIKLIDSRSLGDDIIRIHTHIALEAIDNRVKELLTPQQELIKPIKIR